MPKPQAPRSTTAQWAKIKQEARRMRKAPTPAERVLWHHLVDGGIHAQQREADAIRQSFLEAQGVTVLRFENMAVLNEIDRVVAEIAQVCAGLRRGKVGA